jgi:hypothetical protein
MGSLFHSLCAPPALFDEDLLKECEMRRFLPSHSIKTPQLPHLHFNALCAQVLRDTVSRDIVTHLDRKNQHLSPLLRQLTIF